MLLNLLRVFSHFRTASIASHKVLLSLNGVTRESKDDFQRDSYQCHHDHVYVVVGNIVVCTRKSVSYGKMRESLAYLSIVLGNKSDWLDLAEWLVGRGAQKIVIAVKRCLMSSTNCRRFVNGIPIATYRSTCLCLLCFELVLTDLSLETYRCRSNPIYI